MKITIPSNRLNIVMLLLLLLLGIGSFGYNQYLIHNMLAQERSSVEVWAKAIEYAGRSQHSDTRNDLLNVVSELKKDNAIPSDEKKEWISIMQQAESDLANSSLDLASDLIVKNRFEIPSLVVDNEGNIIFWRNVKDKNLNQNLIQQFGSTNQPIPISFGNEQYSQTQYVYYGESPTVHLLRYYPYIQFSLLALLLGIGYTSYRSITRSEQTSLWVGMAKEAAHQLGTPISSLYGWVELLKTKNNDEGNLRIAHELENDVRRLQNIAERFNKIGSEPELKYKRIGPILDQVVDYMERRLPQLGKNVNVRRSINANVKVKINSDLFQWAIENLIKNAMDAIKSTNGDSYVSINARQQEDELIIDVEDSGKGIEKKFHKEIFKPGYSTKKRGWGLGLSLTKRIIEEYHNGKIFVLNSEMGKGTTVRIVMKMDHSEPVA